MTATTLGATLEKLYRLVKEHRDTMGTTLYRPTLQQEIKAAIQTIEKSESMLEGSLRREDDSLCTAEIADSWGYGQRCVLSNGHRGLHRYERPDGFVLLWGYQP